MTEKTKKEEKPIDWEKGNGLIPAIVQDVRSLRVLMLGYMNREFWAATQASGLVTFYSRSRQSLWQKGETSGNVLRLEESRLDCDGDTLLLLVDPAGPVCHCGTMTCFGNDAKPSLATLADLAATIQQRRQEPSEKSYTTKLFTDGIPRIAQKVGEEGVEVALAAVTESPLLPGEVADLIYHVLVLLEACDCEGQSVLKILSDRAIEGKIKTKK